MHELEVKNSHVEDIQVAFSVNELTEKLQHHKINLRRVLLNLNVDTIKLTNLQNSLQENPCLNALCEAVKSWAPQNDVAAFTQEINKLVIVWLNAFDYGAHTDNILNILRCFKLNGVFSRANSVKFHLFLHNIFIESLSKYHQITLDYVLNYDEIMRLPNTKQLLPNLEAAIYHSEKHQITALFSLHFQTANNNFLLPKLVAQALNKQLAEILQRNIKANSKLYFSGDSQFDIIIPKIKETTQLDLLVAKISRAFEEMILINKQSILLKPYIGCAYSTNTAPDGKTVFQRAKLALEHAISKQQSYVIYDTSLEQALNNRIELESSVLEAFDSNNLTLNFQPIVDLETEKCVGAELLLRLPDKFSYNTSPISAIEILNNVGKGKLFTRWLVNSACRYAYELTVELKLDVYLALNLRAEDLYDVELPSLFSNALSLWKLDPKNIILEITESGILEYNDHTNAIINALSEMGFKFALDDFGTGFSSLTRLQTLPIELIKIDQTFIRNIKNSKDDYKIVQSISLLASSLGKQVLAEGVEDVESLNLIKQLRIDKCQGYYYSKALPYKTFIEWVQAH